MRSGTLLAIVIGAALLLTAAQQHPATSAEHQQLLSPTMPQTQQTQPMQQRTAPRQMPGGLQQLAPGGTGVVARTHCNGTCMCTGDDCTETWRGEYCKDDPVCSSDPGGANRVCTCVKKAAQ